MTAKRNIQLLLLLGVAACGRVSPIQARRLVERYNQVVSEAYRRNDLQLIDAVVAPNSVAGRNLTGLIGVRADLGITMEAHLDALEVRGVAQTGSDSLEVRTRERWTYRDLRADNGAQVGEPSQDRYELLYLLRHVKGRWMVMETQFTAPPQIGRKAAPWQMDARDAHAMSSPNSGGNP